MYPYNNRPVLGVSPFKGKPPASGREPLYTLQEIADRLGTLRSRIHALKQHHPGLQPAYVRSGCSRMYRLSEAKRWWAGLPQHVKEL